MRGAGTISPLTIWALEMILVPSLVFCGHQTPLHELFSSLLLACSPLC